jgi:murein L,D-transpeptidase YcbB/YkuD
MDAQNIDYATLKDRLRSLQPKNRADARYAQLAELKEELHDARKRGVSVNTLSSELKAAGIIISSAALAKYLSRRSSSSPTKRTTTAAAKTNHEPELHGQVKTGTKEPEHRASGTGPK